MLYDPLPRWAMIAIPIAVAALIADMFLGDGWLAQYCVGWPLKMVGQLVLEWGLTALAFFALIRFGYRKLVVK